MGILSKTVEQIKDNFSKGKKAFKNNPLGGFLVIILIIMGIWISLAVQQNSTADLSEKSLWDLLELVIVPATLAIAAYLFNKAQSKNEQQISSNHQEEIMLQDYISSMTDLILEKRLRDATDDTPEGKDLRNVARSRTLVTLRGLGTLNPDGKNRRKGSLLRFLYETDLINNTQTIIQLDKANLEVAYARKFDLRDANLTGVDLYKADLRGADLTNANLKNAYMVETNLRGANLTGVNLEGANLTKALYGEYRGTTTKWPQGYDPGNNGAIEKNK